VDIIAGPLGTFTVAVHAHIVVVVEIVTDRAAEHSEVRAGGTSAVLVASKLGEDRASEMSFPVSSASLLLGRTRMAPERLEDGVNRPGLGTERHSC
jgi:hypothetical protein